MEWIKSGGGPLLCIEKVLGRDWSGVDANSLPDETKSHYSNDYERACAVFDYVGKIPVRGGHALVLGDMPLQTLIWSRGHTLPKIVRVYYADPETNVISVLDAAPGTVFGDPVESIKFAVGSSPLVIFDSAYPFSEVRNIARLEFELPIGLYEVLTLKVDPNPRTSVLVHSFEMAS